MQLDFIFSILVLIMSVVIHEVSHGVAAERLGDPTARLAGRLTLNPLKHLDLMGSIIIPLLLFISHAGVLFGWAKPVPVNPYNLRGKYGEAIVAGAGPMSNILLAICFGLLIRLAPAWSLPDSFVSLAAVIVITNIVLAVFNLVPIPPLDGSKILFAFLPARFDHLRNSLERYGFLILLFFVLFLWEIVTPLIGFLFSFLTGL